MGTHHANLRAELGGLWGEGSGVIATAERLFLSAGPGTVVAYVKTAFLAMPGSADPNVFRDGN